MTAVLEAQPQLLGGLVPPAPPAPLHAAVDDPDKPRCADCNHTVREHIEGAHCQGKLAFDSPCACTRYRAKP